MAGWRVEADIGEIEIERNQHSIFGLTRIKDLGIRIPSETFIKNRFYVMTGVAKQRSGILRKIFVQLEPDSRPDG
jgi:hypothetical protein